MIATLALLVPSASAQEAPTVVPVAPHALAWSFPKAVVRAEKRAEPPGRKGSRAVSCRATFRWNGSALAPTVDACPEDLVPRVRAAAEAWVFDVSGDPSGSTIEVWTVFRADGTVRTVLPPSPAAVTVRDLGVDAMTWQLVAMRPVLHPDGTAKGKAGTPAGASVVCATNLLSDELGNIAKADVSLCEERYAVRVREAVESWRIAPYGDGAETLPASATLLVTFEPAFDGAPPTVTWRHPLTPDLGDRPVPVPPQSVEPEAPTTPVVLALHRPPYAEVRVHTIGWPAPLAAGESASCDVLVQVDDRFEAKVWPERCDPAVQPAVEASGADWVLSPGQPGPNERFARFRGTLVFEGGEVRLMLPDEDVVSETLPEHVRTWSPAKPTVRVAPKLPKHEEVPDGGLVCEIDAHVTLRGRSSDLAPVPPADHPCPEPFMEAAEKAVSKWRWAPARSDGADVESTQRVSVQFKG